MEKGSHRQILKSTGIIGGSQIISLMVGIVRTKVAALILGPSGIGIMGIYQSILDLVRSITGFGINFSGVKDIAEASGSGDQIRIDRTITILRKWALGTGLLGTIVTLVLCVPLSRYAFDDKSYALGVAILSTTLLISSVSAGQIALIQGLRKLKYLAYITIAGAILGTVTTLPLYLFFGIKGIVPGMIATTLSGLVISWFYAKKIKVEKPKMNILEVFNGGKSMAKLGFFIVITGVISTIAMLITRSFIAKKFDLDSVGQFQASWVISRTYLSLVLNAMLADFFPSLSAINKNDITSNKLINDQLEMALILGIPMIIILCAFSPIVILILYSSSFNAAASLLQWNMAGSLFTLISWPLGVMFLAKGRGIFSVVNDLIWSIIFIVCIYSGWNIIGIQVLGLANLIACIINTMTIYISVRYLGNFTFSITNKKYILLGLVLFVFVGLNIFLSSNKYYYIIGGTIAMISVIVSYKQIIKIIHYKEILAKLFPHS